MSSLLLTPAAVQRTSEFYQEVPDYQGKSLRLYIEGKGCDGFTYGVTFDEKMPEDLSFLQEGVELICDPETFQFVDGSTIDWVDDERGQGYLVTNPRSKQFRGKFFKRASWRERLVEGRTASSV